MIVLDIEATGLDPQKHSILSIGAIDFQNPTNQFYEECRIWDGAEVDPQGLEVNGFTQQQIRDHRKKTVKQVLVKFAKWVKKIEDQTIAGQNSNSLDIPILVASLAREGITDWRPGYRAVDLHSIVYCQMVQSGRRIPLKEHRTDLNLDNILHYVGLPTEPKPHHGLTGAKMEAEAFSRILYGKSLLREYKKYVVPGYLKVVR